MTANASAIRWARRNLFAGLSDTLITVLLLPTCGWAAYSLLHWALFTADWTAVTSNIKVMMVGTFPVDMLGRAWIWAMSLGFLAGATMGTVVNVPRRFMVACAGALALVHSA